MAKVTCPRLSSFRALGGIFLVVASASACGSKKGSSYHPINPGLGGQAGTGGTGGAGGAAGAAGGAAGTASGGSAGCTGLQVKGTLDGVLVDTVVASGATIDSGHAGNDWMYRMLVEHGGLVSLEGTASATPVTGVDVNGSGFFAAPSSSALGGVFLVAGKASMKYLDAKQPIVLSSLSRVGGCPGAAVQGSLSVCVASSFASGSPCGNGDVSIKGDLDGAPIDSSYSGDGYLAVGAPPQIAYLGLGSDGVLYVHNVGTMAGRVVFPTTPAAAHAGEVWCVDSVTTKTVSKDVFELTLSSFSLAGVLPGNPVPGTLELTRCP